MTEKTYDILLHSEGWSCHANGVRMGFFPSWRLAVAAVRASAEEDRREGITPLLRYQDLKGTMRTLDVKSPHADRPPNHPDPHSLQRISDLAGSNGPQ